MGGKGLLAQLFVASLVAAYGVLGLFTFLVDVAGYSSDSEGGGIPLRCGAMLLLACGVFAGKAWANRALAVFLVAMALWSFLARHETRFPEEPIGGRAALLLVMSLALLYRGARQSTGERPQNNKMQRTSGALGARSARALH